MRGGARHRGGRAQAPRLARGAGRQLLPLGDGHRHRARAPPGVHRPRARTSRTRTTSSAGSICCARSSPTPSTARPAATTSATTPCRCRAARSSTRACSSPISSAVLPRPASPALRLGDGARAPALLHQHLPVVEARPPLPHGRPQRRDQHAARQRELDGGAAGLRVLAAVRPRHHQALADLLRGPVRHRLLRQRARVPGAGRLQPRARGDDADPGGLGRQSADGCQAPRLLRVSRLPDGAVGRPGRHGLHRRAPDRRHARPQRLAAGALSRHRRRPRHHVVGGRRAAGPGGEHRREMAAAARQDAAHRPGEGPHRLRRGDQGRARRRATLPAMARAHADPRA